MTEHVHHPDHYNSNGSGIECITLVRACNFDIGNAIKYVWRCGEKGKKVEDLQKAIWYTVDEQAFGSRENPAKCPILSINLHDIARSFTPDLAMAFNLMCAYAFDGADTLDNAIHFISKEIDECLK